MKFKRKTYDNEKILALITCNSLKNMYMSGCIYVGCLNDCKTATLVRIGIGVLIINNEPLSRSLANCEMGILKLWVLQVNVDPTLFQQRYPAGTISNQFQCCCIAVAGGIHHA